MNNQVLIVAEHDLTSKGGIQRNVASVTQRLSGEFIFDAVVFTHMEEEEKRTFSNYRDIYCIPCDQAKGRLFKLLENLTRPLRILYRAAQIIKKNKYDAIHCHDMKKAPILLWAAKKRGVPVRIMHCHNPAEGEPVHGIRKFYFDRIGALVNPCSNVKIGCSRDACDSIFRDQAPKAFVVNDGIDLTYFDPLKFKKGPHDTINFIHVGRFTYQKNHEFLLRVFREINKALPHTRLTLVGWGKLEDQIYRDIASLGLKDVVRLLPGDSDIPECMSRADYMIFPSRYEGLGDVLIEAQSMEIMCFAADCVPRETDLGLCDYLSLDSGSGRWAEYIIRFIESSERAERHLDKEKQAAFDVAVIISTYAAIYRGEVQFQADP